MAKKNKHEHKSQAVAEAGAEAGVFGGEDDSKANDPYNGDELSREDLLTLDSFADEEKKAMASPLKASEMKIME